MTDKVINALKCISGEEVYCEECSYSALYRYNFCIKRCAKDAIELINRFKRQCNKYRNKVQTQAGELRRLYKQNAEYKAEIENLRADKEALINGQETLQKNLPKVMAERLIEKANSGFWDEHSYVSVEDIVVVLEEMAGGVE